MTAKQKLWALGLADSTLNAMYVATAGYAAGNIVGHPIDLRVMGVMCTAAAIKNFFAYKAQHPLEELIETTTTTTTTVSDKAAGVVAQKVVKETKTEAAPPLPPKGDE